jgi:hypothetical protein
VAPSRSAESAVLTQASATERRSGRATKGPTVTERAFKDAYGISPREMRQVTPSGHSPEPAMGIVGRSAGIRGWLRCRPVRQEVLDGTLPSLLGRPVNGRRTIDLGIDRGAGREQLIDDVQAFVYRRSPQGACSVERRQISDRPPGQVPGSGRFDHRADPRSRGDQHVDDVGVAEGGSQSQCSVLVGSL